MIQFLVRAFEVSSYVAVFFAVGSLLDNGGIAWAVKVRRLVKQRYSRPTA
jgi:hypothetical protein